MTWFQPTTQVARNRSWNRMDQLVVCGAMCPNHSVKRTLGRPGAGYHDGKSRACRIQ